jgi:hypothetical protein
MKAITEFGKQFLYIDARLIEGLPGQVTSVSLSKSGCQTRYFNVEISGQPCQERILFLIDINQCLDSTGIWQLDLLNASNQSLYKTLVQVHKNEL